MVLTGIFCLALLLPCLAADSPIKKVSTSEQIVFASAWEPISFFPLRGLDSASFYGQTLVYEALIKFDSHLKMQPDLAESVSVSADGRTIAFQLRENLKFSDGSDLTMRDVLATLKLASAKGSPYHSDYKEIDSIETPNNQNLILHLKQPSAPLLSHIAEMRILPAKLVDKPDHGQAILSRHPIGAGPFRLVRWEPGLELVYEPNEYYWGHKPQYKRFVWRIIPDKTLLALALKAGEVDLGQVDAKTWTSFLAQDQKLKLSQFPGSRTIYLAFNMQKPPFDDVNVRRAIVEAINRQSIVSQMYVGFARVPATDFAPMGWAYNSDCKRWPFDLNNAQAKLRSSGFEFSQGAWQKNKSGGKLAFSIMTIKDYQEVAEVVSDYLRKIGIASEVQVLEYSILRQRFVKNGEFQTVVLSRSVGIDPDCYLYWSSVGPFNISHYANKQVDEYLFAAQSTVDQARRAKYYQQAQKIMADEVPWVFLVQPRLLVAQNKRIANVQESEQSKTGLPWDNPLFNAPDWQIVK